MIEGVKIKNNKNNVYLCIVNEFSDQLKKIIKKNLSRICHGSAISESGYLMDSYKETLSEFFERYDTKHKRFQKGMMGELLSHIIFLKCNPNLNSINPFFNMEERGIKKGFDMVFADDNCDDKFWIAEVKSGELGSFSCSKKKHYSLLSTAKNNLKSRLNNQDIGVWRNAMNGARLANKGDLREEVVRIIGEAIDEGIEDQFVSTDKNVILTSVLFNDLQDCITLSNVETKKNKFSKENIFNEIMVFSIQKKTYKAIEKFLREEASDE